MTEETKQEEPKSVVEQAKEERSKMADVVKEAKEKISELRELQATDVLSGKTDQPQPQEKKEMSNVEYAQAALRGEVPEK